LSNLIAWPAAWYFISSWLDNFAYKSSIPIYVFLLAMIGTLFIALTTIAYHAFMAAMANPVNALKEE